MGATITETVEERILANVRTTLEGISRDGGYYFDVRQVDRFARVDANVFPSVQITASSEVDGETNDGADQIQHFVMSVLCRCWFKSRMDDAPTLGTRFSGDVQKAMFVDPFRAQSAHYTHAAGHVLVIGDDEEHYIDVNFDVPFSHKRGDPTERR